MNYESFDRYSLLFGNMILKTKLTPATIFHRIFSQFQREDPEHLDPDDEIIEQNSNHLDQRNCSPLSEEKEILTLKKKLKESHEILNSLTLTNSNLITALRNERKTSDGQLSQYGEENTLKSSDKNDQKRERRYSCQTSYSTIKDYKNEVHRLQAEIKDKADRIHNICVLFMRLKSNKDVLKQKLEYLEAEFNETTMDLIEKLAATRDEINCIADERYHAMKDYRNATTIRAVQKNGQLSLENSMLRLESTRLKQKIFDLENETTFVEVNPRKREVRTVPSRSSFSMCSLSNKPLYNSNNSVKAVRTSTGPDSWLLKQQRDENHQCPSCHKQKQTDSIKSGEFNDSSGPNKQDKNYTSKRSAKSNKTRDIWSGGDAENVEIFKSKYKYIAKPNQRGLYCHYHNAATTFKKNAKESLILQASSLQSDNSTKLHNNAPSRKTTRKTRSSKNPVLEQCSEESLLSDHCNCRSLILDLDDNNLELCSKTSSESPCEETGPSNVFENPLPPRQFSEESVLSEQCYLRSSKSAPVILESTEYHAAI